MLLGMFWICERYSFDIFAIFDNYNEVKEFISNKKVYAYFLKIISLKYLIKLTIYMCIFAFTAKTDPRIPTETTIDDAQVDWSLNS